MFGSESALAKPQLSEGSVIVVLMATARMLRSRMKRKFHVRFCTGGGVGNHPTDRNWAEFQFYWELSFLFSSRGPIHVSAKARKAVLENGPSDVCSIFTSPSVDLPFI